MKRFLIIHYGEIGLKKGNKGYFVKKLKKRIKLLLEQEFRSTFKVVETLSRFLIELPEDFDLGQQDSYVNILSGIFGVKNFKFVYEGSIDLDLLGSQILENLDKELVLMGNSPKTFRTLVKRSMKLDYNSQEAERYLASFLLKNGLDMKAKMKGADFILDVEFFNNHAYFSYKKYQGPGGLSGNSQGKLITLMSSGIDSPVAAYRMMRRGARVIFVHFSSYPYSDGSERENVEALVKILSAYQADTKLYVIQFGEFQKYVSLNDEVDSRCNTLIYRRMMYRLAEKIARKEEAKGLVSGDSFGQVASQTPENLFAVHDVTSIPLFQPLISFDKEEIVAVARQIGTYEISKLPCKDSCTMFAGESVELQANPYDLARMEKNLDLELWMEKLITDAEISLI